MTGRLGIVAGGGRLPQRLLEACRAAGRDVFVLALEGAAEPETVRGVPHAWCRLGAAVTGLSLLRENNVTELVLAGSVRRPSLGALRPDWRAAKLFARIGYRAVGDDGLLSAIVSVSGRVFGFSASISFSMGRSPARGRSEPFSRVRSPRRISSTGCASLGLWVLSISARRSSFSRA